MTLAAGLFQTKPATLGVETTHRQKKSIEPLIGISAIDFMQLQSRNLRQRHNLVCQPMYCAKAWVTLKAKIHWLRSSAEKWYRGNNLCLWKDVGNRNQIINWLHKKLKPCLFLNQTMLPLTRWLTIERTTDPNWSWVMTYDS